MLDNSRWQRTNIETSEKLNFVFFLTRNEEENKFLLLNITKAGILVIITWITDKLMLLLQMWLFLVRKHKNIPDRYFQVGLLVSSYKYYAHK